MIYFYNFLSHERHARSLTFRLFFCCFCTKGTMHTKSPHTPPLIPSHGPKIFLSSNSESPLFTLLNPLLHALPHTSNFLFHHIYAALCVRAPSL